jgi:uncharacterized iron-regulated membrane protein
VWWRRLCFHTHLWAGLILTLYLIAISVTGSILVFREDIETLAGLNPWHDMRTGEPRADPVAVIASVRAAFPAARLISLSAPVRANPVYVAVLQGAGRNFGTSNIAIHPVTTRILGRMPRALPRGWVWLGVVRNFHETLLLGVKGRSVNGILAGLLLLVNVTGIVVWWPGLRGWARALTVDFARKWPRVNFDLHRAAGFWTFALVSFWAVSGLYFGWSRQVTGWVEQVSPLVTSKPPAVRLEPRDSDSSASLHAMLDEAGRLDPTATLRQISFPFSRRAPLEISMQRGGTRGAPFVDTLYFDPNDGRCLAIWKYGVNASAGDWFIWLQIPLHFGIYWGAGVKILWAALGLSIPLLCVTGALMYWNRVLRRKFRRLRQRDA